MSPYEVLETAAQRALVRSLRLAFPDDAACMRVVREALAASARTELPGDPAELLSFVRTHLAPKLSRHIPPNLVLALLDDLAAEVEEHRSASAGANTGSRLTASTSRSLPDFHRGKPTATLPAQGKEGGRNFRRLRASVARLFKTVSTTMRAVRAPKDNASVYGSVRVFVVSARNFERAALARALVGARYDVLALDNVSQLPEAVGSHDGRSLAILRVEDESAAATLAKVIESTRDPLVLVWSSLPHADTELLLHASGTPYAGIVSSEASATELLDAVRGVIGTPGEAGGGRA